jgi:hypothetical protein
MGAREDMSGLYDEDGIDGPFEKGMAKPIMMAKPGHVPTWEQKKTTGSSEAPLTRYRCSCGKIGVWFTSRVMAGQTFNRHFKTKTT